MISWDESMTTGLPEIDKQHKLLIEKFNEFSDVLAAMGKAGSREAAGAVLDFLQFYALWHFEQEEKYMEKYNCPTARENKKDHAYFREVFGQFYYQWQHTDMNLELVQKTYDELQAWIVNHIMKVDVALYDCVSRD
ncbi:MAG: hemerythrin family protein [Anaerolineales bacterium]|nr:hemerythrin family protein [Anaerolineales bacterium]